LLGHLLDCIRVVVCREIQKHFVLQQRLQASQHEREAAFRIDGLSGDFCGSGPLLLVNQNFVVTAGSTKA